MNRTPLLAIIVLALCGCHRMTPVKDEQVDASVRDYPKTELHPTDTQTFSIDVEEEELPLEKEKECFEENDSRCNDDIIQICNFGEWRDRSDCEILGGSCRMVGGDATCIPDEEDIEEEKEMESDTGPAFIKYCNTDFENSTAYANRLRLLVGSTEVSFESYTYCCSECKWVPSGEAVRYELYHGNYMVSYGELDIEGGKDYVIDALPDPLDPMIGILDLTKMDETCGPYMPDMHSECEEGEPPPGTETDTVVTLPDAGVETDTEQSTETLLVDDAGLDDGGWMEDGGL